jgi:2-dehydropantoate 2-reductase
MPQPLRHAILGVGGVGGLMGACLVREGAAVTLVVRAKSLNTYPEQLQLESAFGNFTVPVSRSSTVPAVDVLWIAVKATQLNESLSAISAPESVGAIVPLLNGVDHLSLLRGRFGTEKVIPATIAVEAERVAPGHIVHRSPFARLNVHSSGKGLLGSTLDGLQKIGLDCRFVDDEATLMWSKLVFLGPIALATTAAGQPVGMTVNDPTFGILWEDCVREACAVAGAEGAKVDAQAVVAGTRKLPAHMRSSMQKDVEQGNPPEVDAIAGPILRGSERYGIDVPATRKLVAQVESKHLADAR